MAVTLQIRDTATPALRAWRTQLAGDARRNAVGQSVVRLVQRHLRDKPANRQGFPSSGFWGRAARATNYTTVPQGTLVSINQIGVRQRYHGGVIRPTGNRKFLTIPVNAAAYNRRAGEMAGLKFAIVPGVGPALVAQRSVGTLIAPQARGKKRWKAVGDLLGAVVMFRLVRFANQDPDPTVLPEDAAILDAAREGIRNLR